MIRIKEIKISNAISSIRKYFQSIGKVHDLEYNASVYKNLTNIIIKLESNNISEGFNRFLSLTIANGIRLNYHISSLFKLTSLFWSGHIVHCAISTSRGNKNIEIFNIKLNKNKLI